jgi:hypothetical protein
VRAAERSEHLYIIVTSSRGAAFEIEAAYGAGADDFALKPMMREELLARIHGATRLRAAVAKLASPAEPIASLEAWSSFPRIARSALSAAMGINFRILRADQLRERDERPRASSQAALVSLSLPNTASELRAAIVGNRPTLEALGAATRQVAHRGRSWNVVTTAAAVTSEAVERHAREEDVHFTASTPRTLLVSELPAVFACAPMFRRFALVGTAAGRPVCLVVLAAVAATETACLPASSLQAGMVVAYEIRNAAGGVLLPAGTRLTQTTAARIETAIGPHAFVEVSLHAEPDDDDEERLVAPHDEYEDEDEREAA